jgi:hypothetical protein
MTSERIKEIQQQTAYPDSISVQQALLQVWNECSQLPKQEKDINYWKNNCEEDYITTPISVLRYISELEKLFAYPQQETMYKEDTCKINGNTYITNEEEIKKGDWYLEKAGRQYPILWNGKEKLNFHCKKIILTTDTDLIKDGVATLPQQEISDDEIMKGAKEWYNKEGAYSASAIALKTWVFAIKWYREKLKQFKKD